MGRNWFADLWADTAAGKFAQQDLAILVTAAGVVSQITGNPDPKHVSTSYAERANLTMRMAMRRFTRLTNAFSKKLDNHAHMVALYALWYNFVRIHKTLRTSPAMAAGIESQLWSMEDVVALIDEHAERTAPRLADRLVG